MWYIADCITPSVNADLKFIISSVNIICVYLFGIAALNRLLLSLVFDLFMFGVFFFPSTVAGANLYLTFNRCSGACWKHENQICIIREEMVRQVFSLLVLYVCESSCRKSPLRKRKSQRKAKDSSLSRKMLVSMVTLSVCWCVWWPHTCIFSSHASSSSSVKMKAVRQPPHSTWGDNVVTWCGHMMGALGEGCVRNVRNPHDEDNLHLHHVFKVTVDSLMFLCIAHHGNLGQTYDWREVIFRILEYMRSAYFRNTDWCSWASEHLCTLTFHYVNFLELKHSSVYYAAVTMVTLFL